DVADDPAHAGRGTLVRLDVRGAVVRLRLEGHGPAVADVHHPGVLAYAGEHARPHLRRGGLTEVAQVHLGGLVRAVLGPHDRVHRQLGIRGPAPQDGADPGVLV